MFGTDMVNTDMVFPLGEWLDRQYQEGKLSAQAYRKICLRMPKDISVIRGKVKMRTRIIPKMLNDEVEEYLTRMIL